MSVTGNFFSKLRSLAVTLEKETAQLEHAFCNEDGDYEDECPIRVLHDLHSEIMGLKSDIQGTIDKNSRKGDELTAFLKICRALQKRNSSDIQQVKDTFLKYGYKSRDAITSENAEFGEKSKPEDADESSENANPTDIPLPAPPAMENQAAWDLRAPQLSDFGLSHYKLPTLWEPPKEKLPIKNVPEEKPKPLYRDICTLNMAKTPKCALTKDDDFSQIQHFGISDYSNNLNDDYTIALLNKKKGSATESHSKETSQTLKSMLATPAQLKCKSGFSSLDSPLPPIFCTPGLKVHNKGTVLQEEKETTEPFHHEKRKNEQDIAAEESVISGAVSSLHTLGRDTDMVDSPLPPTFRTPGLKVQKKEIGFIDENPVDNKESAVAKSLDIPSFPSFETKCLTTNPLADPCIRLPTNFQYNLKPASPPKMLAYENMLWTPTRPEMTICITDDISQLLSSYCANESKPSREDPQSINAGKRHVENKENRPRFP